MVGVISGAALKSKVGLEERERGEKAKHISFAFIPRCNMQILSVCRQNIKFGLTFGNYYTSTPLSQAGAKRL